MNPLAVFPRPRSRPRGSPPVRAAFLLGLALLPAFPAGASAQTRIDWADFDRALPDDCDLINVSVEPGVVDPGVVRFVLSAGTDVSWWKAIDVPDGTGRHFEVWTQDMKKADSLDLAAHQVGNGQELEFKKAKLLGVHTGVYRLGGLGRLPPGSRVTFAWVQDRCPQLDADAGVPRAHPFPEWMEPGRRYPVTLTFFNRGSDAWTSEKRFLLAEVARKAVGWGVREVALPHAVPPHSNPFTSVGRVDITFEIVAPSVPGRYHFDWGIVQKGVAARVGESVARPVIVDTVPPVVPPPPSPPPPPALTWVPQLVGMPYDVARKELAQANLRPGYVDDPFIGQVPDSQKTVTAQHPLGGSQVREGTAVNLSVTADPPEPQGFRSVVLYNCGFREVTVWEREGDQWVERGSVSPQWGDGGLCPAAGAPFEGKLRTGAIHELVVVEPGLIGCGQNDPRVTACRKTEGALLGDEAGPVYSLTLH